jgi:SSS family solute:Na+ symporter
VSYLLLPPGRELPYATLLGYMVYTAGLKLGAPNDAVPSLFKNLFPSWFAGFAIAAIAVGALVPAAVMSIGAANLFTRNFWKAYVNPSVTPAGEASVAKIASLVVKVGALLWILCLPPKYAIDMQLIGGLCILQTFPSVVFGLYTHWFRAPALLLGWAVGLLGGAYLAWNPETQTVAPLYTLVIGGDKYSVYIGLLALAANVVIATIANLVLTVIAPAHKVQPAPAS